MVMPTYSLRFEDDGQGEPKTIRFDGADPHEAFRLLQDEAPAREVSIWEGDKKLAVVRRGGQGVWALL